MDPQRGRKSWIEMQEPGSLASNQVAEANYYLASETQRLMKVTEKKERETETETETETSWLRMLQRKTKEERKKC